MADLLQEMETTLTSLKAVGNRADELHARSASFAQRVETDRSAFVSRSSNVVPRAQALLDRIARTQETLQTSFSNLSSQVQGYRQTLLELQDSCTQETGQLFQSVEIVQLEHSTLHMAVSQLQQETGKAVFQHGVGAQEGLQSVPPGVDALDTQLREQVLPASVAAAQEVVRLSDAIGKEVHQTVVPALSQHANSLQNGLETGAGAIREKALKLSRDLDSKSKQLMKAAEKAAQDIHERSNGRLVRLLGEVQLTATAIKNLIRSANRALSGLHSMRRKAMGVLKTITSIVDSLVQLLQKIRDGVKIS